MRVLCYFHSFVSTASGKYYILSGQHRFEAARAVQLAAVAAAKEPPIWSVQFRCTVVRQSTDLQTRQLIAGKTQAAQSTVLSSHLSDRIDWFRKELQDAVDKQDLDTPIVNRTQLLRLTYIKTGCREREDGSMV